MLVGYARVSSSGQSLEIQLDKLCSCEKLYQEKRSGARDDRPELHACLDFVREGDTLVVTKIDRLARSTLHLCTIAEQLASKGVHLQVLDQAMDTRSPTGRLTFQILAVIAEFENAIRRERQLDGIAKAKAAGRYVARKALSATQVAALQADRGRGLLITDLMRCYRISKASVYRYLKQPPLSETEAAD